MIINVAPSFFFVSTYPDIFLALTFFSGSIFSHLFIFFALTVPRSIAIINLKATRNNDMKKRNEIIIIHKIKFALHSQRLLINERKEKDADR